ncbi:MAG: sodium-dependent transporter [Parvularculaceae bacterium]|nr:sodium-dependent transporter [Parvularculaceae bacterium]
MTEAHDTQSAPKFSGMASTVLTLAGVAIGLGNVWRFPYMMGSYGGSAFLLLYFFFMLTVALPAFMAELALARSHRGATITVMRRSFGAAGRFIGYLLVFGVLAAASYYTLVVGNVFYSAWFSIAKGFSSTSIPEYSRALGSPVLGLMTGAAIVWAAIFVIDRGLKDGIERISRIFVPFFFLICLYLIAVVLRMPGSLGEIAQFMKPDFARIGPREIFAALGQCYFSAGLGAAYILVYGKFLRDDSNLQSTAFLTSFSDMMAAVLASLFIIPAVLSFGMELSSGPRLLFGVLPELFAVMPDGRMFGSALLVGLCLVAFLSVIASFEVITVSLSEEPIGRKIGERRLRIIVGAIVCVLIALPAWRPDLIEGMDLVFGSGFTIFGGMLAVIATAWIMNGAERLAQFSWPDTPSPFRRFLLLWLRWGIPAMLVIVLGAAIYDAIG